MQIAAKVPLSHNLAGSYNKDFLPKAQKRTSKNPQAVQLPRRRLQQSDRLERFPAHARSV